MKESTSVEYYHSGKTSLTSRFISLLLPIFVKSRKIFESQLFHCNKVSVAKVPGFIRRNFDVQTSQTEGRNVFALHSKTVHTQKYILYLHGGAYIRNFFRQHWQLLQYIVNKTGYTVVAPDYPLAPHYTFRESFLIVEKTYKDLIEKAGADNVIIMGDSAGGGFGLALVQKMKHENTALPEQLILLSPWFDASLENPDIKPVEKSDPFLSVSSLRECAQCYSGNTDLNNYLLSPINGNLAGLPKTSVFIGTRDIFIADARKFKAMMQEKSQPIHYFEYPDMVHVWMLIIGMPEATAAKKQIIELLQHTY